MKSIMGVFAVMLALAVAQRATASENLKVQLEELYAKFGQNSTTKIKVVSGPEDVKMRNGGVPGKRWIATSGPYRFKLTIQETTNVEVDHLVQLLEKLPKPYMRACEAVSDETEDGIAIYADLGGASAHGGKSYINLVPGAGALVVAHEAATRSSRSHASRTRRSWTSGRRPSRPTRSPFPTTATMSATRIWRNLPKCTPSAWMRDRNCSMMRFLLYANEWDMAGIIYCRSRFHWKGHDWAGEDWIQRDIDLYAQTYENLERHAPGFPSPQELKDRAYIGNTFSKPSSKCSRRLARSNLPVA